MEAYEVSGSEIIELMEETGEEKKKKTPRRMSRFFVSQGNEKQEKNRIKIFAKKLHSAENPKGVLFGWQNVFSLFC